MTAWYNEIDPFAAGWLRELIKAGLIAPGIVDERSIEDVLPNELMGYTQCHFFAGIGVWSYALRQAGWPDDKPAWTGSCPCQPFSAAGKGIGFADERHLWPAFHHLIAQCKPAIIFGEQVAGKAIDAWIDLVHADLEAVGYAFGSVPFPSAGVGAPHIRDRNFWVADAIRAGSQGRLSGRQDSGREDQHGHAGCGGTVGGMADANLCEPEGRCGETRRKGEEIRIRSSADTIDGGGVSDTYPTNGFWRDADWLACRDGKWRPVEPGTFPLVASTAARMGRLRGYGNAINAEAAKAFIEAYIMTKTEA